jgi:hypothetical protein
MVSAPAGAEDAGGFAEQHAAAFALFARTEGFATRVCVGYLLRATRGGVYEVTNHDAHAWPEVYLAGRGWVPFEPTDIGKLSGGPATSAQQAPRTTVPPAAPPPPGTAGSAAPPDAPPGSWSHGLPAAARGLLALARALLILLLAMVVLAVLGIPAGKAWRRWRRSRGPAASRVLGAWQQGLDHLTERSLPGGFTIKPADTPVALARMAVESFGAAACPLTALAARVTAIEHGSQPAGDRDADWAWRQIRCVRRGLDRGRFGRLAHARATFDPRPLWREAVLARRGRRALRRLGGGGGGGG